ncbi:MAG TPA: hypothetical protein VHT24_02295 [Pseudacidobacterium sp.]|jgi:hypothetical protein|nr:hypothetical protein [Pseudacidobacterium sp.]
MSEHNPFRQNMEGPLDCEEWEALLADALDGTLKAKDQAVFTAHGKDCPVCGEMLAQTKRGQEWMQFLHEEPVAPADMVTKILGRTSGATVPQLAVAGGGAQSIAPHISQAAVRRAFRDSRLLMTVAMAFFSIALTLNLVGVHLNTLHFADLKPSALQMTVARQFYGAKKQMVSYYESLRLVYEVESKVRELRRDAESEQQQKEQPQKDDKQPHKNGGKVQPPRNMIVPQEVLQGKTVLASVESGLGLNGFGDYRSEPPQVRFANPGHPALVYPRSGRDDNPNSDEAGNAARKKNLEVNELVVRSEEADQAERSLA